MIAVEVTKIWWDGERLMAEPIDSAIMYPENFIDALKYDVAKRDSEIISHAADNRAIELLQRCENEMRYAGWYKFQSDNTARNGVYEQVKQFLEQQS